MTVTLTDELTAVVNVMFGICSSHASSDTPAHSTDSAAASPVVPQELPVPDAPTAPQALVVPDAPLVVPETPPAVPDVPPVAADVPPVGADVPSPGPTALPVPDSIPVPQALPAPEMTSPEPAKNDRSPANRSMALLNEIGFLDD